MLKTIGVILGGVFIGTVGMEVFRRTCPGETDKLYSKTRQVILGAKEAFKNGYANATRSKETAVPAS